MGVEAVPAQEGLWLLLPSLPPPSSPRALGAHPWCQIPGPAPQLLPPIPRGCGLLELEDLIPHSPTLLSQGMGPLSSQHLSQPLGPQQAAIHAALDRGGDRSCPGNLPGAMSPKRTPQRRRKGLKGTLEDAPTSASKWEVHTDFYRMPVLH